jgi:hypothetical protein
VSAEPRCRDRGASRVSVCERSVYSVCPRVRLAHIKEEKCTRPSHISRLTQPRDDAGLLSRQVALAHWPHDYTATHRYAQTRETVPPSLSRSKFYKGTTHGLDSRSAACSSSRHKVMEFSHPCALPSSHPPIDSAHITAGSAHTLTDGVDRKAAIRVIHNPQLLDEPACKQPAVA